MRQLDNVYYTPSGFINSENSSGKIIPGQGRNILDANMSQNVKAIRNLKYINRALETREVLACHLTTDGSVPWHLAYIR